MSFPTTQWGPNGEDILRRNYPLHQACRDGDVERLNHLLIEAQKSIFEEDCFYGWTPVHWAAYFGKLGCLHKLVTVTRAGADYNVKTSRLLQSPSHLAAFGNQPRVLNWLIQAKADINIQDYLGETPFHKAARSGSMECLSLLVAHGARGFIRNNDGLLPHEVAAKSGQDRAAAYLESVLQNQEMCNRGVFAAQPTSPFAPVINDVTVQAPLTSLHNGHNGCGDGVANGLNSGYTNGVEGMEEDLPLSNGVNGDNIHTSLVMNGELCEPHVHGDGVFVANGGPFVGRKRAREVDMYENYESDNKKVRAEVVEEYGNAVQYDGQQNVLCGAEYSNSAIEHQYQIEMEDGYDCMVCSSLKADHAC